MWSLFLSRLYRYHSPLLTEPVENAYGCLADGEDDGNSKYHHRRGHQCSVSNRTHQEQALTGG